MYYLDLHTIGDLLARGAVEVPDRDFLVIDGIRRTYHQMHEQAVDTARSLAALGVGKGDRVGLYMPNCPEFLDIVFGAAYLGAISVPINARFRAAELRHVIPDAELKVLCTKNAVADEVDLLERLGHAFPELADHAVPQGTEERGVQLDDAPNLRWVVSMGSARGAGRLGQEGFDGLRTGSISADEVDERRLRVALRDVGMMFYTSGTTSMPKGCPLTHEALVRTGVMTGDRFGYRDGDVMFDPLPMFHTASTQPMIATMDVFGTFVSMGHFDASTALDLIADEAVTVMFTAFPPITEALLNHDRYGPDTFAQVRSVFNVAPPDALRSMQARMPHSTLVNAFGMTEFGGSATMVDPDDELEKRLTQGRPLPGVEVEIRDPHNEPLGPGEMGEIVLRGPSRFEAYHNAPEKNAETIEADGWWHSGDLGVLRQDGRLEFKGRLKDMLKVGGENVAAIEIESHLQAHPAVNIAQVVGMPDDRYGEVPAAFIELRPKATATEEEIIAHCEGEIASFKVPRYVRFVTEWPMSSTKVQKFKLREMLEKELA